LKRVEVDEKNFMREQQKIYKDILDSQVKTKAYGGITNPYYQNNTSHHYNYINNHNAINLNNEQLNKDELTANINNLNPNLYYNSKNELKNLI